MKRFGMPWGTVYANSDTTAVFLPATPWMDASTVAKVKVTWELRGVIGTIVAQPALQVANVANSPGAVVLLGSGYQGTPDTYYEDVVDVADDTKGSELVRFGWSVKLSSGSTLAFARVGGSGSIWDRC